jgi:hypothetical protein
VFLLHAVPHSKKQAKEKEQHVIRTDMDVNKHERLSNITLRNKLSKGTACNKNRYGCK